MNSKRQLLARLSSLARGLPMQRAETLLRLQELAGGDSSFVPSLISMYRRTAPEVISELKRTDWKLETETIVSLAHRLKGLSQNLGLDQMAGICQEIETTAKTLSLGNYKAEIVSLLEEVLMSTLNHLDIVAESQNSA